jgi:hypothetical protein
MPPFLLILWMSSTDIISSYQFFFLLLFYACIYRTYTDGKRLAEKGIIVSKDIWKMIIPGQRFRYLKELYLQ